MNTLYYGDNLDILRRYVDSESVDLVYLDPPFKSNQDYNVLFEERMVHARRPKSRLSGIRGIGTRVPRGPLLMSLRLGKDRRSDDRISDVSWRKRHARVRKGTEPLYRRTAAS